MSDLRLILNRILRAAPFVTRLINRIFWLGSPYL